MTRNVSPSSLSLRKGGRGFSQSRRWIYNNSTLKKYSFQTQPDRRTSSFLSFSLVSSLLTLIDIVVSYIVLIVRLFNCPYYLLFLSILFPYLISSAEAFEMFDFPFFSFSFFSKKSPSARPIGWIDPGTPLGARQTRSFDSESPDYKYELIMSDEFNVPNRTFADGEDPTWTAMDHSDDARTGANEGALVFYNHSYVTTTKDGQLNITTTSELTHWKGFNPYKKKYSLLEKQFRSGMINSWNKFCFAGGIVEIRVKLPGRPNVSGLWPAFWLMGNLGRALYEQSTNLVWPWTYDKCDRKLQPAQEISACAKTHHFDLIPGQGRGSPEIDIMEVYAGPDPSSSSDNYDGDVYMRAPYVSTTLQSAPGIRLNRPTEGQLPNADEHEWYTIPEMDGSTTSNFDPIQYGPKTKMNPYFYGFLLDKTQKDEPTGRSSRQVYQSDAISALTPISLDWNKYQTFRLEWTPSSDVSSNISDNSKETNQVGNEVVEDPIPEGKLVWYLNDELIYSVKGNALNITGAKIPSEPSYLILNTGVSTTWGFPSYTPGCTSTKCYDCSKSECLCHMPKGLCEQLPASMLVDYIRVYQPVQDEHYPKIPEKFFTGCNHCSYPTSKFIEAHKFRYIRDTERVPLQKIQNGYGTCKKDSECKPGGICNLQSKACVCERNYTGPYCRQPNYGDLFREDSSPSIPILPLSINDIPPFLALFATVLLIIGSATIFIVGKRRDERRKVQIE